MAKPIFLVRVYSGTSYYALEGITKNLSKRLPDYHVIVIPSSLNNDFEFEVYNSPKSMIKQKRIKRKKFRKICY